MLTRRATAFIPFPVRRFLVYLQHANFLYSFSFSAFAQGDLFRIHKKALQILKLESFRERQ